MNSKKIYGYTIGQMVYAKRQLADETGKTVEIGEALRIVDIAPKVCIRKGDGYDGRPYFPNLVRANEKDFWETFAAGEDNPHPAARIRTNFCNISRVNHKRGDS